MKHTQPLKNTNSGPFGLFSRIIRRSAQLNFVGLPNFLSANPPTSPQPGWELLENVMAAPPPPEAGFLGLQKPLTLWWYGVIWFANVKGMGFQDWTYFGYNVLLGKKNKPQIAHGG